MLGEEDDLEDTHLCIKCEVQIVGLANYIEHRKTRCGINSKNINNSHESIKDHNYEGSFSKKDTSFTFNYDLEANDPRNYDELGADLFFSSLELQSSNKKANNLNSSAPKLDGGKVRKVGTPLLQNDDWIQSNNQTSNKKDDAMFRLFNESPEQSEEESEEEDDYNAPPRSHTGGKWKPENRPIQNWHMRNHWTETDEKINEYDDDFTPPQGHTKGKWVPGSKIIKLEYKPEIQIEDHYWCNICNRQLASKLVYERHLKSNMHIKRAQDENELEEASKPAYMSELSKRITKPSIYLNQDVYVGPNEIKKLSVTSTVTSGQFDTEKAQNKTSSTKRKRKTYYTRCEACKTRLPNHLLGKHLISHYHYRRMINDPENSFAFVLKNMHQIMRHSPFQCQPCRFYANTEANFMLHWNSGGHEAKVEGPGRLWCSFCKFECDGNDQMMIHLNGAEHQDVVFVINRSVPIIIRKITVIKCELCQQDFRFNIELKQHERFCSANKEPGIRKASFDSFPCKLCTKSFHSMFALQNHEHKKHSSTNYYCSVCSESFGSSEASKAHRRSAEHKIMSAKKNNKEKELVKKCPQCKVQLSNIIELKLHVQNKHPEVNYSCPQCGESFVLAQELGRHVRDKTCSFFHAPSTTTAYSDNLNFPSSSSSAVISQSQEYGATVHVENSIITNDSIKINMDDRKIEKVVTSYLYTPTSVVNDCPSEDKSQYYTIKDPKDILPNFQNILPVSSASSSLPNTDNVVTSRISSTSAEIFFTLANNAFENNSVYGDEIVGTINEGSTEIIWECKICPFRTSSQAEFLFHEILHNIKSGNVPSSAKIDCPLCKKQFRKQSLRCHLRQHTDERIYQCEVCPMSFTRKSNLKDHVANKHKPLTGDTKANDSGPEEICICQVCGKQFGNRKVLDQHVKVHYHQKTIKGFSCQYENCFYLGRSAAEVRSHLLTHSEERHFPCTEDGCNYKGKTIAQLKRHSQRHSEQEKKFKCLECDFSTRISGHLKRHVRIHTGSKPYSCPYCDYTCNNVENLRKHVISTSKHRGRFLYECKHCEDETSRFKSNFLKEFNAHLMAVHKIENKT